MSQQKDALDTLGFVLDYPEGMPQRDAIHLAVVQVQAGFSEVLRPGQHIGLEDGLAYGAGRTKKIGIVDPFIQGAITEGDTFWLVLYPRTITGLRHVWSHPDFPEQA